MALQHRSPDSEELYIMDRNTQVIAGQTIVTWKRGAKVYLDVSISNMMDIQLATVQGVIPTGYVAQDLDRFGNVAYPIGTNTYLEFPRAGAYIRITDDGVFPPGEYAPGAVNQKQYAAVGIASLPRS